MKQSRPMWPSRSRFRTDDEAAPAKGDEPLTKALDLLKAKTS